MSPSLLCFFLNYRFSTFTVHDYNYAFFFCLGGGNSGLGLGNGSSHLTPALPVPNGFGTDNLDLKEGWVSSQPTTNVLIVSFT
jgi:hypothetical protein